MPSLTLGEPATVSLEIRKGSRTGFQFDANGRQLSKKSVNFKDTESDSASRYYRQGTGDYYLLTWGPLAGYWVKIETTNVHVLPTAAWKVPKQMARVAIGGSAAPSSRASRTFTSG